MTVPAKRKPSWGTIPSWRRSDAWVTSRRSWPSIVIAPVARVVEAGKQLRDRRLARAGVADERDGRPGRRRRGRCRAGPPARRRSRSDVLEATWPSTCGSATASGASSTSGSSSRTSDDLVQRRRRREERVVELRELLHRVEEVLDVEHEGEERSERDVALEVEVAAVAEDDRERDRREQVDEREVEAVEDDGLHVRVAVALGDLAEVRACSCARA